MLAYAHHPYRYLGLLLASCLAFAVHAAETATSAPQLVRVMVPGQPALVLDATTLSSMPHISVTAAAHEEKPSEWRGVALREILSRAGAPVDKPLRGKALASFVRVTAADHYQVVFGLADLDPSLGNTQVMLADQRDGQPLASDGPYRLLVTGDQRPARWVRQVTAIEVIDASSTTAP